MEDIKDIKYILIRSQKNEITIDETFNEISLLIEKDGYYNGDDLKRSFELGQTDSENDVTSNDNVLVQFNNNVEDFVNFISNNGFYSKSDIDSWYKIGNVNKNSERTGEDIKQICLKAFNMYLMLNWD